MCFLKVFLICFCGGDVLVFEVVAFESGDRVVSEDEAIFLNKFIRLMFLFAVFRASIICCWLKSIKYLRDGVKPSGVWGDEYDMVDGILGNKFNQICKFFLVDWSSFLLI